MESLVGALSETLIAELALRDELEYEKELKNQFKIEIDRRNIDNCIWRNLPLISVNLY